MQRQTKAIDQGSHQDCHEYCPYDQHHPYDHGRIDVKLHATNARVVIATVTKTLLITMTEDMPRTKTKASTV